MKDEKCPECHGYLYRGWHTNTPGDQISREADHAICVMTGPLRVENAALRRQLAEAKAAAASNKELADIVYERAPSLRKEGPAGFDGYFAHFDEFIRQIQMAWPDEQLGYSQSPWELLTRLIDERDAAQAVIDTLPKCADTNQPIVPGPDAVWCDYWDGPIYSTRAAAEAAKEAGT